MFFFSFAIFFFIYLFVSSNSALAASFNTTFPTQQFQCTNFNVNISSSQQPAFPLTLLILPASSSTPLFINIPESQWNPANNSLSFNTILPYPSGMKFMAAIQDSQSDRDASVISQVYTMQGTPDTSCFAPEKNLPSRNFFALNPSPPLECSSQTLSVGIPNQLITANTTVFDNLQATGYIPGGSAFFLKQAADVQFAASSATWTVDIPAAQDFMFLFEYRAPNGTTLFDTSAFQTVQNGTTSCIRAASPIVTILATNPQGPLGVETSSNTIQISSILLIFIAVASILGSVSAVVIFIIAPIVYLFRRRRKAKEAQIAFQVANTLEAGTDEKGRPLSYPTKDLKPAPTKPIPVKKTSFFSFRRQKKRDSGFTPVPRRVPRTPAAVAPGRTPQTPIRKSSVSSPKASAYFKRSGSPTPSGVPRMDNLEIEDDGYYSRATLFLPGTVLYDKDSQQAPAVKEQANINAPYSNYTAPYNQTPSIISGRQSPANSFYAQSPASATSAGRVRGKEPLPPLPPNPGAIRRPSKGRLRNENSREREKERERSIVVRSKGQNASIDSFGNEGPLPLSMTETDIPPRPKLSLITTPTVGVALTTGLSPTSDRASVAAPIGMSRRRDAGMVGGNIVQPLRLGPKSAGSPGDISRPEKTGTRIRFQDLELVTEQAAQAAAAVVAERGRSRTNTPITPRRL